jgi:integrase
MSKITQRVVSAARSQSDRDVFIWDSELRGFGLRVKPSGTRSFLIQYRTRQGATRRHAFARHPRLTAAEARTEARALLGRVERGVDPSALKRDARAALSVSELCTEYLAKAENGEIITRRRRPKKVSTLATDRGRIERHIKPLLGHRAVKELTAADIRDFLRAVTAGKTAADVRTRSRGRAIVTGGKGTAARTVGLLGGILSYAVEQAYIGSNPVTGVRRPADERRIVNVDRGQFRALGRALEDAEGNGVAWQAIAAIRLLALTGCRRGEIEQLRWQEVDAPGSCLRLGDTKRGTPSPSLNSDLSKDDQEHENA